jgi:hypothetical protein
VVVVKSEFLQDIVDGLKISQPYSMEAQIFAVLPDKLCIVGIKSSFADVPAKFLFLQCRKKIDSGYL